MFRLSSALHEALIPAGIFVGLAIGLGAYLLGSPVLADGIWQVVIFIGSIPFFSGVLRALWKKQFGVDLIAVAAVLASVWAGAYAAGVVILLMLATGEALEAYAQARATRELTALLKNAPTIAHIKDANGTLRDVRVEEVVVSDSIIVKPGEVIPVDGLVTEGVTTIDESVMTGESVPVEKSPGSLVYSGCVNQGQVFVLRTTHTATNSKYQTIVRLVQSAQSEKAPVVRLADRYAVFFNLITFALALVAWMWTHDPVRVLSVLVVASPCPLLLATPIAMISGMSKAASRGIVIKNGSALELLGQVKGLVFDKTGTLTLGTPEVVDVIVFGTIPADDVVRIAASVDQLSAHIFARALVKYAQHRGFALTYPEAVEERFGQGVTATVNAVTYIVGSKRFVEGAGAHLSPDMSARDESLRVTGKTIVYLAEGATLVGAVVFADIVRPETSTMFTSLLDHKIKRIVMLTGDKLSVASAIAKSVGITEYFAELLPEQKVDRLKQIQQETGPVVMVGDGINDAPALATASVGIAMASHGATAASEAGDVVIMDNNMVRVHDAIHIAQRSLTIATQGILFGMGVSTLLMIFALFGFIPPILGAVAQELLDAVVIIHALRLNIEKIK